MRQIETTFQTFGASVLLLGFKGDSNATEILIDCAADLEEYQGTMAAMSITGPDETVYPGVITLDENYVVHWVVAARDCGIAGHGSARIDLVDDDGTVVASAEATTIIIKTKRQNVAPDQIADWTDAASVALQEVNAALLDLYEGEETTQANEAARQLAEEGRVSAELLRGSAETARATAETARATAETARASAETARETAETARAAAETARVAEMSTIETNAQAALSYIGPSEASSTASAAHPAGSYFIYNGKLYKATAAISVGDTITSGTNCAQVSGGAMGEVSDLKSAFDDLETTLTDEGIIAPVYKLQTVFNNSTVYSTGTITDGSLGYNVYVFHVPAGATVVVTGGNNYGLYADVPVKNTTVSVDGTRHVGSLNETSITMPTGANYLAVVNSAEPTVDPIDTTTITDRVEFLEGEVENLEDRYTVVEPENFITLSQDKLYGIPSDMEVSISNNTITFSYPYASGNKGNFGFIFDELVNGKSYTLNFDVTSGGLAAVSNIRVVTLYSDKGLASLLGYATNTGSHYSCTFIANTTANEPYIALMLAMTRSISTTATLSNISVIATGETEYTKLKNTYVRDLGQESFSDDVNEILNSTSKSVKITIANSDKIGYISNSFLNGYTIRGHHAIENISMFSDYLHYNYGKSGDNAVSALIRIENDSTWLGAVPISEWGMKYAVIAMEDNDKAMYQINRATYYQNFKKLCEAVRALGAVPILGTEHDVSGAYYGLESLAREQGIMFMNWGKVANALKCGYFPPFWNNNHPATRTAWLWSNGMKQYLDTLPRPEKSIKLFRVRDGVDTTDLDNLVYNDNVERAERFAEIHVGQKALTAATEKYFDRMDVTGPEWEDVNDEYQTLQAGTDGVSFGSFALVECVTPYDGNGLTNLTMSIESTGVTKAYIKKNKSITLPYNWATYIAFGVTAGAESLTPNSTFQITGGVFDSSLIGTYTVDSVVNGIVITKTSSSGKTTSGTDAPVCSVSGVVLAGSYTSMSSDYLANYTKPIGEYMEITEFNNDGVTDLSDYLSNCVDYDKISVLLAGTSIDIEKIEFNAVGNGKKARAGKALTQRIDGTSILTDTLLDDNTAWNGINDVPKYTPVASTKSSSTIEALPGVTTVRILDDGDSIYQSINTSGLNTNALKTYKLQIRVIARYFPEYIDTDAKWAASEVTETSYDCARLAITIGDNDVCARAEVGAYWNEYIFDVDYISGDKINVACENKSLQIAKVECELIN